MTIATIENLEELVRDLTRDVPTSGEATTTAPRVETIQAKPHSTPRGYLRSVKLDQAPWPPAGLSGPGFQSPRLLPKRPTGRLFVGGLLTIACAMAGWSLWSIFPGVAAYGVVKGDTLPIISPWDGRIAEIHVSEGQSIRKGDLPGQSPI